MSSDESIDPAQRRLLLKQQMLRRAFEENRGPAAMQMLNNVYRNIQTTRAASDEDIRNSFRNIAVDGDGGIDINDEWSQQQLESVLRSKTIENPEIRDLMKKNLKMQNQVVDYLRGQGIPENMLPLVSPTLAYLNAVKTLEGQKTVQFDSQAFDRIEKLLSGKPPTNTLN